MEYQAKGSKKPKICIMGNANLIQNANQYLTSANVLRDWITLNWNNKAGGCPEGDNFSFKLLQEIYHTFQIFFLICYDIFFIQNSKPI